MHLPRKGDIAAGDFAAQFIDEEGKRQSMDFDLTEKKYDPLDSIL